MKILSRRFLRTLIVPLFLLLLPPTAQPQDHETVAARFLRYVRVNTQSREDADSIPSSAGQWTLAHLLEKELHRLGVTDVTIDDHCYLYASLPPTLPDSAAAHVPAIALVAHLDTSPETSGDSVVPLVHKNYQGGPIVLPGDTAVALLPDRIPHLREYVGSDIITARGTTLLGADDKAGIAEIMTAVQELLADHHRPHGAVKIAFTPDEEVTGAVKFDLRRCGALYAYTIDGEQTGEISNETWNADEAVITFRGKNTHPGSAKGIMVNSLYVLADFIARLPEEMKPETTDRRTGFLHPYTGTLDVGMSKVKCLLRSFDLSGLEKQKNILFDIRKQTLERFPSAVIDIDIRPDYRNMRLKLDKVPFVTSYAAEACREAGVQPDITPTRGGTDGAILTEKGLPCPNIFTGAENIHSVHEWIPVRGMEAAVQTIINLVHLWTEKSLPPK